jgi:hypothetical protein
MTTPDIAGLCERLRAVDYDTMFDYPTSTGRLITEAADALERQAAEIERLRGAAKEGLICAEADVEARRGELEEWVEYEPDDAYLAVLIARRDLIRAALTGEDT